MDRDALKIPSGEAAQALAGHRPPAPMLRPVWQPLRAPGFISAPARDSRKVWPLPAGWSKRTLPSAYEEVDGTGTFLTTSGGRKRYPLPDGKSEGEWKDGVMLPDPWTPDRDYHHAWYVVEVDLGESEPGTDLWLRFDAVGHACAAFINGREVGRHLGGYTPFEFDISKAAASGVNTLAIWVQDDSAVFDAGAQRAVCQLDGARGWVNDHRSGIRGGIYLERRQALHVARIRVRTSISAGRLITETWIRGGEGTLSQTVAEWPAGREPVLTLPDQPIPAGDGEPQRMENAIDWPDARRWSPEHPHLYVLRTTLHRGDRSETVETRFGFREFRIEGKQFLLNGATIRLFGDGSHPRHLMSTVPDKARDFGREALLFLKREFHYNACRLHGSVHPGWATEAADEAGVLIINQSGLRHHRREANERGGAEFLRNVEREFEEWVWRDVNSPSVVIWDVENELLRSQRRPEREAWILKLDTFIRRHDPDAIIEHSGAGWYHPDQQILHVHMQEQYARIMRQWRDRERIPLVLGEFWMGGRGETRLPNSREYGDREDWHREEARLFREKILEMRQYGVSGILSHRLTHWPLKKLHPITTPTEAEQAQDRKFEWRFPAIGAYGGQALAPVLAFAWPRHSSAVRGDPFEREIVICNDLESAVEIEVACAYGDERKTWPLSLNPGEQQRMRASFLAQPGTQDLTVEIRSGRGEQLQGDRLPIHAIPADVLEPPATKRRLYVAPAPDADTKAALQESGLTFEQINSLPSPADASIVIVAADAAHRLDGWTTVGVKQWLAAGGRLLVLPQTQPPRWMPIGLPFWSAVRTSVPEFDRGGWEPTNRDIIFTREAPVYAPDHPVFSGLADIDFHEWSPMDGRISDDAFIRPNALNMPAAGPYRVLLGATRRENASLVEARIDAGTVMFCQAQVTRQRIHPGARALFYNLVRYLDGPAWAADTPAVGLLGELPATTVSAVTGLDPARLIPVRARSAAPASRTSSPTPNLILAGDGADPDQIRELARDGATVLVLSADTCGRLPGFSVEGADGDVASGTRSGTEPHPLFAGMAGASFLPLDHTPVRGVLSTLPDGARVLMGGHWRGHSPLGDSWGLDIGFYGLETREPCGPLAAAIREGNGEVIATAIEPWNARNETHRQWLCTVLANAGVPLPNAHGRRSVFTVKWTEPLRFDGHLDDWTNDMDDNNISVYSHADPIALTSSEREAESGATDLDYSAILYFLHDAEHLYIGGFILSSGNPGRMEIEMGEQAIAVEPRDKSLRVNGEPVRAANFAAGRQPAAEIVDSRLLNLARIHPRSGKAELQDRTPGVTFETALPWTVLGRREPPGTMGCRVRLVRDDGVVLALPLPAERRELTMKFDPTKRTLI